MASNGSKFFTWTKGDRKHVSHGMVQIPVECIAIKDMGYGRSMKASRKAGRKPLPLNFADTKSGYSGAQTQESSALHEAAVRSATSLLAAMSDVLKSPQFISNQNSDHLLPVYGRPRSRTAPPTPATPLVEAPISDPVELPAPDTAWQNASVSGSKPIVGGGVHSNIAYAEPARCHSRSRSSTNQMFHKETGWTARASGGFSETNSTRPSVDSTLRNSSEDIVRRTANRSQDSLSGPGEATPSSTPERDTLRTSRGMRTLSSSQDRVVAGCAEAKVPSAGISAAVLQSTEGGDVLGSKSELLAHIIGLRTTHESHITALKEAHCRELVAFRTYIALLESQQPSANSMISGHPQVADTYTLPACGDRTDIDLGYSGTGWVQSVETMTQRECLIDAKSSAQTEAHSLRRERDYYKSLSHQVQERNSALEHNLARATETEVIYDNSRSSLQASVAAANMQRIDALATLDNAHEDLRATRQREGLLRSELDELRQLSPEEIYQRFSTAKNIDGKNVGVNTSPSYKAHTRTNRASKIDASNDHSSISTKQTLNSSATDVDNLRAQLLICQNQLQTAKRDRERYNVLLHSELRRQSKLAAYQVHANAPEIQQRASVAMASRRSRDCSTSELTTKCTVDAAKACVTERELRYCFEEIIMYKLDIKGYKKDLKTAHARIASLEGNARPETPERDAQSNSRIDHNCTPPCTASHGLGIVSLAEACPTPRTGETAAAATSPPPAAAFSRHQATSLFLASPPRVDHQSASIHKALPEPPPYSTPPSPKQQLSNTSCFPRTPPPPPCIQQKAQAHLQRTETLRSLSDSIISSYTKRGTTNEDFVRRDHVPPLPPVRHGRSESARTTESKRAGGEAVMLSIEKFSAGMVKTPPVVGLS